MLVRVAAVLEGRQALDGVKELQCEVQKSAKLSLQEQSDKTHAGVMYRANMLQCSSAMLAEQANRLKGTLGARALQVILCRIEHDQRA